MKKTPFIIGHFSEDESGATTIEYALVLTCIALGCLLGVTLIGASTAKVADAGAKAFAGEDSSDGSESGESPSSDPPSEVSPSPSPEAAPEAAPEADPESDPAEEEKNQGKAQPNDNNRRPEPKKPSNNKPEKPENDKRQPQRLTRLSF